MNRQLAFALIIVTGLMCATQGLAHHGWRWTTGNNIELIGLIETVRLGNPHGVLTVNAEDEIWTVEIGQPHRNERAGLRDEDFAEGVEVRVIGEPSADINEKRMKAEIIYLGDREFNLYPDRS